MRGAVVGAILFEGRARTEAEAVAQIVSGGVRLSVHHHQAVGPMGRDNSVDACVRGRERTHGNARSAASTRAMGKSCGSAPSARSARPAGMDAGRSGACLFLAIEAAGGIDLRTLIAEHWQMATRGTIATGRHRTCS